MAFEPREHLITLRGSKEPNYLEVKWRLVWWKEQHPEGTVVTELVEHDKDSGFALYRAKVGYLVQHPANPQPLWVEHYAHGSETKGDFGDYLEKAETKAIGRALAIAGYGTQFTAEELSEGDDNPVDSPTEQPAKKTRKAKAAKAPEDAGSGDPVGPPDTAEAGKARGDDLPGGMKPEAIKSLINDLWRGLGMKPAEVKALIKELTGKDDPKLMTDQERVVVKDRLEQLTKEREAQPKKGGQG